MGYIVNRTENTSHVDLLDRISYKKNVHLRWQGVGGSGGYLIVEFAVPDSYHPEITILVAHSFPVPWNESLLNIHFTEQEKLAWILERIFDAERHEAREFFKVDGKVFDPPGHGRDDPYL